MPTRFWLFLIIALLTLAGCSSYTVISDYDNSAPFGNYKSYRWNESGNKDGSDDMLVKYPLTFKHIKTAVNRELAAKGFMLTETGPVNFTLTARAKVRELMVVNPPVGFAYYSRWGRRGYTTVWHDPYPYPPVSYYEEGTLIIDVTDTKTGELAWSGIARGLLKDYNSSDKIHREIDEVVKQIIAQFPPVIK
ncbi:MAG: DUF4136 domain-containing protein [Chlorobiaceae bacterium]|nr:DUF4136 domain-containing protein [Chlorobiaceae bacterium]